MAEKIQSATSVFRTMKTASLCLTLTVIANKVAILFQPVSLNSLAGSESKTYSTGSLLPLAGVLSPWCLERKL